MPEALQSYVYKSPVLIIKYFQNHYNAKPDTSAAPNWSFPEMNIIKKYAPRIF